jgi:hypothetical protein
MSKETISKTRSLQHLIAAIAFPPNLFALFCTLYVCITLWGGMFSEKEMQQAILGDLGNLSSLHFFLYLILALVKIATAITVFVGMSLWNFQGVRRTTFFRNVLMIDVISCLSLLIFGFSNDEAGPPGYFNILAVVAILFTVIWIVIGPYNSWVHVSKESEDLR